MPYCWLGLWYDYLYPHIISGTYSVLPLGPHRITLINSPSKPFLKHLLTPQKIDERNGEKSSSSSFNVKVIPELSISPAYVSRPTKPKLPGPTYQSSDVVPRILSLLGRLLLLNQGLLRQPALLVELLRWMESDGKG